uniref:FAD-dependent pyridine nucleotide-disulphide oxidoreductase n=1 Tax=mine drainage metagenome TaxID=410659 RepID=E6PXU8_9ZZZZ
MYDAIVVGAGPAGLSAALILGRCRRKVLICDTGQYRNEQARAIHGFLTQDGVAPAELLRLGRTQLQQYETIEFRTMEVRDISIAADGFSVLFPDESVTSCHKILLATGVVDQLPPLPNIQHYYGRSVFHCPYCDGWEQRDQPIAIYGRGEGGKGLALELTRWSRDLVLCTDGPCELQQHERTRLDRHGIQLREENIVDLEGADGQLRALVFADNTRLSVHSLFFTTVEHQRSYLPRKLGCKFNQHGTVQTGVYESTDVHGLYVAGDASRRVQLAIVAAAEGAEAAFAINTALIREDLERADSTVG